MFSRSSIAPTNTSISVKFLPAMICLDSLIQLQLVEQTQGFGEWVTKTYHNLTPDLLHLNKQMVDLVYDIASPILDPSFPALIARFASYSNEEIQQRWIDSMNRAYDWKSPPEEMLYNLELYLHSLEEKYKAKGCEIDRQMHTEIHALLNHPQVLRETAVNFMRQMNRDHLGPEWEKRRPHLEEVVLAHRDIDYNNMSPIEVMEAITTRRIEPDSSVGRVINKARELIFTPSPHIGPYVAAFPMPDDLVVVVFGARFPRSSLTQAPTRVGRSDLLVRLNALADDVRLQILQLLAHEEEMCAQEILMRLSLSQSAASRHLKQLAATGLPNRTSPRERQCYRVNWERIDETFGDLKAYLHHPTRTQGVAS